MNDWRRRCCSWRGPELPRGARVHPLPKNALGELLHARHGELELFAGFSEPEVVRYLFVHELAHTRHMNHSSHFWNLVEKIEPDYRRLDRALLAGWRTVPGWVFKT